MKALYRLLGLLLVLYLIAAGGMYLKQRDLLFVRDADRAPLSGFWLDSNGTRVWIDRLNPGQPAALLYFPGNTTSDWDDPKRLAEILPHHTIYFMRYRGFANSEGSPSQQALYADALALFDHVKSDHRTIDLMGRSLGTGMAVYVAAKRPARKLILTTPYDGILLAAKKAYPWLPVSLLLKDPFPSYAFAPAIDEQTRVILAKDDQTIPYASSKNLIDAFRKSRPEVITLRGTTHSAIVRHPLYLKTVADFLAP
jgi:pimeloyl-ACP methyl ester carboxylesterase